MPAMLGMRAFALAAGRASGGVYCGVDIPLLKHSGALGGWSVRLTEELNDELTARYRLRVDIAAKANALVLIAHALSRGDLAMAAIATMQMQLPDPPSLSKGIETTEETLHRAANLRRSGLLKYGDWNPEEHPRTGVPPNPGWFASVEGDSEPRWRVAAASDIPGRILQPLETGGSGGGGVPPSGELPPGFSGANRPAPGLPTPSGSSPAALPEG